MNIRYWVVGLIAFVTMISGALLWSGCEVSDASSSTDPVFITPESVVLKQGQTAQFQAHGGYDYKWSLDQNDGSGKLNTTRGDTVIYTCLSTNIGSMPKTIRVTSTIAGSAEDGGASNSAAYAVEATAEVFWPGSTGGGGNVSISPSGASNIATNGTKVYTASGGTSPYTWTVSNSSLGSVSPSTGNSTTYTAKGAGVNTITVTDSASHTDSETITQP
jgi:hypothetical protein